MKTQCTKWSYQPPKCMKVTFKAFLVLMLATNAYHINNIHTANYRTATRHFGFNFYSFNGYGVPQEQNSSKSPFSLLFSYMEPKKNPCFVVTSSPVGLLEICFWPDSHIPKQCDYSGKWGKGKKNNPNFTPPVAPSLTFPSCQNS